MASLQTQSYSGFPLGMNVSLPAHEIADGFARYLQDTMTELPGITRRRGPIRAATGFFSGWTLRGSGILQTFDPTGQHRVAVLEGDGSNAYLSVLSTDLLSKTQTPWTGTLPNSPYYIVDAKPALNGGTLVGTSKQYSAQSPVQALGLWRGGAHSNYSTGTVTVARGATAVTGVGTNWGSSNASSGMFLFNGSGQLVGVVKSVDSTTGITLEQPALLAISGAAYELRSVRGINPRVVKGRITCTTAAATVTGANTKFKDQGLDTGTWDIYRARDLTWIGQVSTVTNNTSLTFGANAAIALDNERYIAIRRDGDYGLPTTGSAQNRKVGFITAEYAGKQFYLNQAVGGRTIRLHFSDETDPEALDLTEVDGDWFSITDGTPQSAASDGKALVAAFNSLLILKENESYALFGSVPEQFELKKVLDDGALSGMSAQPYEGGVVFAGREGVYFYDGVNAENITEDTLGHYYRATVANFNPATHRMWSMVDRDHYFLFIESATPNIPIIKGTTATTPSRLTIVIDLPTRKVEGMHTNLDIRGSITLPTSSGFGTVYLVNTSSSQARICAAEDLFDVDAADTITCEGNASGPSLYIESKKYDMGDPLRKKLWKQLMLHYYVAGGTLKLDTIVGLNTVGAVSASEFGGSNYTWDTLAAAYPTWDALAAAFSTWDNITPDSLFQTKRIKFLKRSQFFQFRLYQSSTAVTKAQIGPFALGFKAQRVGRI